MAKTSEKVSADKQPQSHRGKSRFDVQPRSNRVVLPDRPPREVDNEIVSILLGGDPASLVVQIQEEPTATAAKAPPFVSKVEFAQPIQDRRRGENPNIFEAAEASQLIESDPGSASKSDQASANDFHAKDSPVLEVTAGRSPSKIETSLSIPTTDILSQNTSLPRSDVSGSADTKAKNTLDPDLAITSFEEFADRWRHGLRKGQLKVCEVLYQKTYALGEMECVTSFSELGRLSGLKMRQCFNIIAQLEVLKFIERAKSEITSNKKDQGSIIRFYLFPRN